MFAGKSNISDDRSCPPASFSVRRQMKNDSLYNLVHLEIQIAISQDTVNDSEQASVTCGMLVADLDDNLGNDANNYTMA